LGVFWLMQASEQGCQEATEMLQNCLDSAEGITEHNYLDVKACLNTSLNEKLARRAAREMFMRCVIFSYTYKYGVGVT